MHTRRVALGMVNGATAYWMIAPSIGAWWAMYRETKRANAGAVTVLRRPRLREVQLTEEDELTLERDGCVIKPLR